MEEEKEKPCYAPSYFCITHQCSIEKCCEEGRCSALYAYGQNLGPSYGFGE